jgi:hypothetical protein
MRILKGFSGTGASPVQIDFNQAHGEQDEHYLMVE